MAPVLNDDDEQQSNDIPDENSLQSAAGTDDCSVISTDMHSNTIVSDIN